MTADTISRIPVQAWQVTRIAEILQAHQDEHFVGFLASDGRRYCGARVKRGQLECLQIGQSGWVAIDPAKVSFVDHDNQPIVHVL